MPQFSFFLGLPNYPYEGILNTIRGCLATTGIRPPTTLTGLQITSKQQTSTTSPVPNYGAPTIILTSDTSESASAIQNVAIGIKFTTSPDNDNCSCSCTIQRHNFTRNTIRKFHDRAKTLLVERRMTSRYLMTKQCATDDRASSRTIGYVGISFLVAIVSWICLPDFVKIVLFTSQKLCYK